MAKYDAVILDVDGTLWDSTIIVAPAWEKAIKDHAGLDKTVTPDMLKGLFGKTMDDIADALVPELPEKERYALMDYCCEYEQAALENDECNTCYPNVKETIRELSKTIPVLIVSNCQSGYIELFLDKTGLGDFIKDFECFGNNNLSKADNIKLIMSRNSYKNCVYVGDTVGDMNSAHEAGNDFVFCSYGFGNPDKYEAKIDDFSQLKDLI